MTRNDLLRDAAAKADRLDGDHELEVDGNARVSVGEDGYWVEAWLFVRPPVGEEPDIKLDTVYGKLEGPFPKQNVSEDTATSFRGIGFNTDLYLNGMRETLFFHMHDSDHTRFAKATPEAVEEFCAYWQSQIDTAREYVANNCNPNTHEWGPRKLHGRKKLV